MSQTPVFSGSLDNGLKFDIFAFSGFAGHAEVAIQINGHTASIVEISENRAGHNVKVVQTNKFVIPFTPTKSDAPAKAPTLGDIAG